MRTFVSPNGDYGFALKGDDIVSLFKNPNSDQPGVAGAAIDLAVQQGGRRADAFDTVLPDLYAKHGLRVVARLAWDDKEAPPGWDKKTYQKFNNGEPDVVFMVYDPASTTYTAGQGERVDEYDDGKATQDRELEAIDAAKPPEPPPPPRPEQPRFGFGEADPKLEINRQISADYVLREGRRTDTEHLRWIDLATGELSPEIEEGTEKEVGFGPELGKALDDPSRAIEVDHNHPNSSPLSVQDLAILSTKPGCYGVRALGHDGSIYAASRPARHDIRGAFKKARGAQYTDADEFLVDEITSEKMEPDRGTKIFFHAVSDALGRNGWFDYGFRLAPDLQRDIDRLSKEYNALVADMQKRAGPPPTFAGRSIDIDWEKYPVPNAFIDPPGEYEPLDEWISYRKELDELSHLPGIEPFKQEADEIIERKRRQQK
jgi:hypothetical protein